MKNIVLITCDSLRADHCGFQTYQRDTTPNLSDLEWAVFQNAYSTAPCTPASVPSFLTGTLPLENGHIALNKQETLQEKFNALGYDTCLVNSNIQIPRFGYDEGFDSTIDFSGYATEADYSKIKKIGESLLQVGGFTGRLASYMKDIYHAVGGELYPHEKDKRLLNAAAKWIENTEQPYFCWIHLMDTHYPYNSPEKYFNELSKFEYNKSRIYRLQERAMSDARSGSNSWELNDNQRQYVIDAYDASIMNADYNISKLISSIDLQNTTVVVSSDHGEELWEHGYFGHAGRKSIPRDMTLYEEMLHVPLYIIASCPLWLKRPVADT
jgi:arylsulfatase